MAARLTDRQKKKILADYVQTNNYSIAFCWQCFVNVNKMFGPVPILNQSGGAIALPLIL